ncbi:MAG TPA: isocitrate/isopropylmalate family dehydrogenase [Kofleriaceae bacterium]|nr:isocitrate/isopropylmalate family dehydrogenase [Kofleriaceae bacterium]
MTNLTDMWLSPRTQAAANNESPARVVVIGGDGVGPEVVAAAVHCLRALKAPLEIEEPAHGLAAERSEGSAFPDATRRAIDTADAVLFGACDTGPDGRAKPILHHLRFGRHAWANIRPACTLDAVPSKLGEGINMVIVRELSEGAYPGREGELSTLTERLPELRDRVGRPLPRDGKFAVTVTTAEAARRVGRYAATLARHRADRGYSPGKVTVVDKGNVLVESSRLFREQCEAEAHKAGVAVDHVYVDEAARRLVAVPQSFDVIVTTNLFGDILSDISAEAMGGMPMAPSAAVGDSAAYFEPCHGSGPDIAGRSLANPTAAILSAAMMLAYLGHATLGDRLAAATLDTVRGGERTADLGGSLTTEAFADRVAARL